MATKEQREHYADEVAARFEAFTKWAIEHWPNKEVPLMSSDFAEARKEIGFILGSRLSEAQTGTSPPRPSDQRQYVNVNPAPWP